MTLGGMNGNGNIQGNIGNSGSNGTSSGMIMENKSRKLIEHMNKQQ